MEQIKLKTLVLKAGKHVTPEDGMCIMEAVAYFANEPFSDAPACACPVLTAYMIVLNDNMRHSERQMLKPYIKKLMKTKDSNSQKRAFILAWASITEFAPHCLQIMGLSKEADALRVVPEFDWLAAAEEAKAAMRSSLTYAAHSVTDSAGWAAESANSATESAAESAAELAASAAAYAAANAAANAAAYAADSVAYAADSVAYAANALHKEAARKTVFKMALKALDRALEVK